VDPWPPWKWCFKITFALLFAASTAVTLGIIGAILALVGYAALAGYQYKRDKDQGEAGTKKPWSSWSEPPR
jgi:hypothetical protein